jgi:hypothetical protein
MRPLRLTLIVLFTLFATVGTAAAGDNRNFVAHLNGEGEVPATTSLGQGQAIFHLSQDGTQLEFKLIAANIVDVAQAHIHCGTPGVNGPVVVFLYGFGPVVSPDGVLSEGTITAANVIPRPSSAACPGGVANFNDLIEKLRNGGAYVNAHTIIHPGGEIRGEIH